MNPNETRSSHPSSAQVEILVEFMERNPGMAKGFLRTPSARERSRRQWEELTVHLNSIGGTFKTYKQWTKYWSDKKNAIKKKVAVRSAARRKTNCGVEEEVELSELEERVVALCGVSCSTGDAHLGIQPVPNIQPETPRGPVPPEDIVVFEEVVISDTESPEPVAAPSPVEIQELEPEPNQTDDAVGEPARYRPRRPHKASLPRSRNRVARSRFQVENKLADAAVMIAEATKVIAQATLVNADTSRKQLDVISTLVEVVREKNNIISAASSVQCDDFVRAVDKRKIKVFCPKCKTKVLHNVDGMQKDKTSKVTEQEYEELTKTYKGVDLTPLLKFSQRTALATGVSETTILEKLLERARWNADVPQKTARERPRQPKSSSEEDGSGGECGDDGEHYTTEHVDEPEVYVAGVKTELDACGDDRELADPISVHVNTEPQNERDMTCSETVAVQSAAKRHKRSIKQRNAEAPPASSAPPSGQLPLPPDQQFKVENPLTNEQGFG